MISKTKIILGVLLAIVLLQATAVAKTKVYMSHWQIHPISIKGELLEWQKATVDHMKKWDIEYRFANNKQYLYALLILKNWKFMSSINQTGLTVWINLGKKKKRSLA